MNNKDKNILNFILEDDTEYLMHCLDDMDDEELTRFLDSNPEILFEKVEE